jgi:imidazole glycerol-phosphate synthase subunit HisH
MKTISIVNYGLGNIYSIQNAINLLSHKSNLVSSPDEISQASHLILPGVGAYPYAMKLLKENGLNESILEFSKTGKPILGICLGMQLLFEASYEHGYSKGLNLLRGKVDRFKPYEGYSIPQIQWNQLVKKDNCLIMSGIKDKEYFYFVNSYCVDISNLEKNYNIYFSNYANQNYLGLIEYENIIGAQFHPEKSGKSGLTLLKNFILK